MKVYGLNHGVLQYAVAAESLEAALPLLPRHSAHERRLNGFCVQRPELHGTFADLVAHPGVRWCRKRQTSTWVRIINPS